MKSILFVITLLLVLCPQPNPRHNGLPSTGCAAFITPTSRHIPPCSGIKKRPRR